MKTNEQDFSAVGKMALAVALIVIAAVVRALPHPWNFGPIGAMALFSGAMLRTRWMKFALPLVALFVGDIFVGFHVLMPWVYASFVVSVLIGMWVEKRKSAVRIGAATLAGSIQFFLVTNFAVWAMFNTYPKTLPGLAVCYLAGLPLFWNTLAGDALYVTLLLGGYALAERFFLPKAQAAEVK